jgi:peptide deformylase
MEILEIKKYPDSILRKKCELVKAVRPQEKELFEAMLATMYSFKGIGLAAPQIGIIRRLIVADIGEGAIKLADPEIIQVKGDTVGMVEGCLSLPEVSVDVKRPFEIRARGLNEEGETVEIKARGLLARVIQHEIDHLNGKLIIDYAGLFQKIRLFKSRMKQRR